MPRSKGKGKARESSQSQNEGFDADNEDEANEEVSFFPRKCDFEKRPTF